MFLRRIVFVATLCVVVPAYADPSPDAPQDSASVPTVVRPEDYIAPAWPDLLHTMVRFNAIDLHDNNLIDEYAAVTDCEIYKFYYKDDFKWNEIRKKIRESSDMEMMKYPAHYYFYTVLKLDRYDFEKKMYRFSEQTTIHDVNVFTIYTAVTPMCNGQLPMFIPKSFQAVADATFTMVGLPLAPADAQALLRQMNADKNTSHDVVVKFNMTVIYIDRLRKTAVGETPDGKGPLYMQTLDKPVPQGTLRMEVHLDSVNFYEDLAMTKLVYSAKL